MELGSDIIDWAWARHHNEWSWYIRPFIILAFCAAAWFRQRLLIVAIALFFPLSAVIFLAPEVPKPYVVAFLQSERALLAALNPLELLGFVALVGLFLWALAAALWHRSFWLGILVANLGGVVKLIVSLWLWGEDGQAAILPTLATALVFNGSAFAIWRLYHARHSVK